MRLHGPIQIVAMFPKHKPSVLRITQYAKNETLRMLLGYVISLCLGFFMSHRSNNVGDA